MPDTFRCERGHEWQAAGDGTLSPAAGTSCPACGAGGVPVCVEEPLPVDELPPPPGSALIPSSHARPPAPSELPPELDGYEVGAEIARGGMAVVYRARQRSLDRLVALKILLPGAWAAPGGRTRVRAEAEAIARLQHPNVVHVYEVGERDGCPYILMEYVDGGTLADRLGGRPIPPEQAAEWAEAIARGIHAAHRRGIVHRDLKPANVLMTADGVPKITDFGLARRLDGPADLTRSGMVLGTPAYMAPEQAEGHGKSAGPTADIWAIGAILYEMLTGRPPFTGESALEVLQRVSSEPPIPPSRLCPELPPALVAICLKCLQKRPADRYPTAEALADDLAHYRTRPPRTGPAGQRRLVPVVVGTGFMVVVLFGVWFAGGRGRPEPGPDPTGPPTPALSSTLPSAASVTPLAVPPPATEPLPPDEPKWEQFRIGDESEGFQQIAFPTRDIGYVASRTAVYRTNNGGQEWKPLWKGKPGTVHFLTFEDADHGWLGGNQLYHTPDGGRSWHPTPLPGLIAVRALALGRDGWGLTGGSTAAGEPVLFRRRSGAREWERLDPAQTGFWGRKEEGSPYQHWLIGGLAVTGPHDAWATLSSTASEAGVVLHTADQGNTWRRVHSADTYLQHIHFANPRVGWLAGFRGKLWRTEDGGRTWTPQVNPEGEVTVSCLAFARNGESVALAPLWKGQVLWTDNGRTWQTVQVQGFEYGTPAAAMVDPGRAYVLGADGRVARYSDPRGLPRP